MIKIPELVYDIAAYFADTADELQFADKQFGPWSET